MINFTPADTKSRFPNAIERTYGVGQVIIYDGDTPNFVRFIKTGAVKFYDSNENGDEKIMHISGKGSIFPLFYSFEKKRQVDGFYAALIETTVIMVPWIDFSNELKSAPGYAFMILQWYTIEMDHLLLRLKSMEKGLAKDRVLQALLYLSSQHAVRSQDKQWYRVNFAFTQQTLADMTGLTRETVNITLKDPRYNTLVRYNLQTYDIDRSAVIAILK